MPRSRFQDAIDIQNGGACNLSGIANALIRAAQECREERLAPRECPAIRLMVHQMAFLAQCEAVDNDYMALMDQCAKEAALDKQLAEAAL